MQNIIWVETLDQLASMTADLNQQPVIGVDTESDSLYAYHEKVCLIQISTPQTDYLVDSIQLRNLSVLDPVFSSPTIEKIFHAAEYDIICLKRDFGFSFNNLFDTMLASRILGYKAVGLSNLLQNFFEIKVNKKFQRANWSKRPLSEEMLAYAVMDSRYLIDIARILKTELKEKGLKKLAEEDFLRISKVEANPPDLDGDKYWRFIKGNNITPQQTTVFFDLCRLRETIAANRDVPEFKVFNTTTLLELARRSPLKFSDLTGIEGLSQRLIDRHGAELLRTVKLGMKKEPTYRPLKSRPSDIYLRRYEKMKQWRKEKAAIIGVESDVILPKEYLDQFAQTPPRSLQDLQEIMSDIPFRYENYGKEIFQAIHA